MDRNGVVNRGRTCGWAAYPSGPLRDAGRSGCRGVFSRFARSELYYRASVGGGWRKYFARKKGIIARPEISKIIRLNGRSRLDVQFGETRRQRKTSAGSPQRERQVRRATFQTR